jgi:large subunit ribosomal protein L13
MMKTYSVKADDIKREWHIIDASDEILGKLATRVARLLSGKHKPLFARNMDVGDFVVVINASKIRFTGKKAGQKMYYRHSQYPGGLRSERLEELVEKYPERIIEHAVKGMLPRNRLNARMMKRLRIFTGADNPYGKPKVPATPANKPESN